MLTLLDEIFIVVIGVGTLTEKIIYCEYSVLPSQQMKNVCTEERANWKKTETRKDEKMMTKGGKKNRWKRKEKE